MWVWMSLGTAAHVLLLEAADPFADGSFDFALCLHKHLERAGMCKTRAREAVDTRP
jgi:hypothetical protein